MGSGEGLSMIGEDADYRGRIAPTPSGALHAGHARTFYEAWRRARQANGTLILRLEDIDGERSRREFEDGILKDLEWLGIDWDEGVDRGGPFVPYRQSERMDLYRKSWRGLCEGGYIYPSSFSRKELSQKGLEREADGSWKFPASLREEEPQTINPALDEERQNWRFKVPNGVEVAFTDGVRGEQVFIGGKDFGDFLVWRRSGEPSYELAVVVDDISMEISEVVRGEDLLLSTARQILLYRAMGGMPPAFRHVPLVLDENGKRLSKTERSLSVMEMKDAGMTPSQVLGWMAGRGLC